uniref:Integrase, catalytic region, zinc finger, CCHC-type, peptidase aspartic, catalytic n=1 Tax=Tanacetum cinerariifolium TaxID=118510 RepID=A0A699HU55_TANCI|nr:integrase, catalytic region, zinc finger, CCHC-type, peptidase aspartic, catalytic [Tanacetum cinerariifolium]
MSNTNNNIQTQTSNTLHNAIMEAVSKDRPPMLAPGNYVQWKSRIKRYIDTKPNHELIHHCLKNPPYKFTWAEKEVPIAEGGPVTRTESYMETYKTVSQDIRDQLNAEAEAVQIILIGIDNDIYSTVDACSNAYTVDSGPVFDAEPLQKVSNDAHYNVFTIESEHPEQSKSVHDTYPIEQDAYNVIIYSLDMSFDREEIDQNDDNNDLDNERELLASLIEKLKCEIDERKNRNKFLETSNKVLIEKLKGEIEDFKNKNKSLESSNNRFKEANNKLSETNNLLYTDFKKSQAELARRNDVEYASNVEIDCEKARGDLISYKIESQKSFNKYTQTINDLNLMILEMKNKLYAHQETISILSQQKEAQIKLYKNHKDKELDKVIALENKVKKSQRVNPRLYNVGCYNDNLALMLAPESDEVIRIEEESRSKLSDLIRPFDYDKLNNLYDLFVPQREKSSEQRYFSERSKLSHTTINNGNSKESFNKQATLLEKQMDESISTYSGYLDPFIQNTIEAKFSHEVRRINAGLEQFHMCLNEEMVDDLRYFNSLELEVDSLRSQLEYQKTQFLNEIDRLSKEYYYADHMNAILEKQMDESILWDQKCKSSKELFKIKRSIGTIFDGVECCKEIIAKRTYFGHIDPFIQNTIEENFSPEIQKINADLEKFHVCLKEEMVSDMRYFNSLELEVDSLKSQLETQKTQFLNEIDRLSREYYYADHVNAILGVYTELDEVTNLQCAYLELLEKCECIEKELSKSKMMLKSFEALQKHAINLEIDLQQCKSTIFSYSLERKDFSKSKSKSVTQNNVSNVFSKPITAQTLPPNKKSILKNTNVLATEMYKLHIKPTQDRTSHLPQDSRKTDKRMSFSTGVISTTSVSRPQLKSNTMEDRVMLNNSKRKKQEVEDQRKNVKFSKNKTSVTACNDSLKAKTLNVNFVCATCGKCVLNENHDMCVLKSRNGVNSRTTMPTAVPVSTREPKRNVTQSVAKPLKKTIASESNQKPRNTTRKLYERISKACSWWYPKFTPSGYKWKPKSEKENVNLNLIKIVLFIVDSGCSKHMTRNLKLLINFVEKFLGTVKFGNDQIAPILGYGDLVQGAVTIKRVYYVEGLNHNLFSVGQFCDADLEVAFRKSTCYIRDLKGNDLLTGTKFLNKNLHAYFASEGILHQTSIARTLEQNGVVERRNRTLVEAARTMLSAAKVPLFFWAEAIATTCFTQNRHIINERKHLTTSSINENRQLSSFIVRYT